MIANRKKQEDEKEELLEDDEEIDGIARKRLERKAQMLAQE
jgi:hypothetical protein